MDEHESDRVSENSKHGNDGTSRHGKSKSSWGLSSAVHAVHGVGFVAKKVVNNKLTESLWHGHSRKSTLEKDNRSHETDAYHHASKPTLNVANEQTAKLPLSSKDTHERENHFHESEAYYDTSMTSSNVADEHNAKSPLLSKGTHDREKTTLDKRTITHQSENLKPQVESHVNTTSSYVIDRSEDKKPKDGLHAKRVNETRRPNTSGTNVWPGTTSYNVVDHSRSSKPLPSSHARPIGQHKWPSAASSNVVDQKPIDGSNARLVNQHRWPSTGGTNVLSKNVNHPDEANKAPNINRTSLHNFASKPLPESSRDHVKSPSAADNDSLRIEKSTESQPSSPSKSYSLASRGVSPSRTRALTPPARDISQSLTVTGDDPSLASRGVSLTPSKDLKSSPKVRGVSLTPQTKTIGPPTTSREVGPSLALKEVESSLITRGVSHSPKTRGVSPPSASRVVDPTPTVRGSSPVPTTREVSPTLTDFNLNSTESCPFPNKEVDFTPARGVSPSPSYKAVSPTNTRGVSPTPGRGFGSRAKDASPPPVKPSARRHFFSSHILSIFTTITHSKKDEHVTSQKDIAQHLELLYNIQVQWQFANASAEAALALQKATAEKSLSDMWKTTLQLRDSIASKKIDINLLILQLKLYAVLYRQMAYIDEWAAIQREYESALSVTTNDLQARSLSVPIIGGVKADINALKLIMFSTIQVLQATISSIQSTLSKLDKTHFLASELANVALHERALLDECEIFLSSSAPLQIEECSLRSYIIQTYGAEIARSVSTQKRKDIVERAAQYDIVIAYYLARKTSKPGLTMAVRILLVVTFSRMLKDVKDGLKARYNDVSEQWRITYIYRMSQLFTTTPAISTSEKILCGLVLNYL
ncbi:QWRF motif-containing protein 4-like protein [Tanacetum coccineum]